MATRQFATPDGFVNETTSYEYATPVGFLNETVNASGTTASPPLLSSTSAFYNATVSVTFSLTAPILSSASAFYNATVSPQIALTAPVLSSTSALYDASVSVTYALSAPLLSSTSVQYNASVAVTFNLDAPLLASSSVFYDHVVSVAGVTTVVPPLLSSTSTLYNASVSLGTISVGAPLLSSTSQLYAPSLGGSGSDTHDGFDPYARKRKAKGGKRKKEVEDLLAKLMGLVPEDAPEEIEQAVEVAKATVERISAPQVDYTDQIAALQTAQLQLAKLDALLRSYEDEEEDEDLLLMSM